MRKSTSTHINFLQKWKMSTKWLPKARISVLIPDVVSIFHMESGCDHPGAWGSQKKTKNVQIFFSKTAIDLSPPAHMPRDVARASSRVTENSERSLGEMRGNLLPPTLQDHGHEYYLLRTTYYLLRTTYYILPDTYYLLSTTYYY